jgi:hypothetical protein
MPRTIDQYKSGQMYVEPHDNIVPLVIIPLSGSTGQIHQVNFSDGSIEYYGHYLRQMFRYTLVDNIGGGQIRVSYNRPDMDLTLPVKGAKTLSPMDSIYIDEDVWAITVYFLMASTVEIVAKSFKDDT